MTATQATPTAIVKARPPSLFHISEEFAALDALLEEQAEGATEADADVVSRWWEQIAGSLTDKLTSCVAWIKTTEWRAKAARGEAHRLAELARVDEAKVARLKALIREIFDAQNIKRIETALGPVRLQGNGGAAPLVFADNFKM